MGSETVRDRIPGPGMMDAAQFPELAFHGACHGNEVVGDLTMHGQTHPVTLDYIRPAEPSWPPASCGAPSGASPEVR